MVTDRAAAAITAAQCPDCLEAGRRGYCAPGRCYCGHPACHAFASFVKLSELPTYTSPTPAKQRRSSWDDREESTWIDEL